MKKIRHFSFVIAVVLAAFFLFSACGKSGGAAQPAKPVRGDKYGGNIVIQTNQISTTMDPLYYGALMSNYQWMQYIYENAVAMGADGKFYPQICDYEYSDDGLTLKLTIKDYYFSDGSKVTIEDVAASLARAAKLGGSFATKVMNFVTNTVIEGNSVIYTFKDIVPIALTEIADTRGPAYIMPKRIIDKIGFGGDRISNIEDVIGTGCYLLESYKPDVAIVLKRNEKYKIKDFGGNGPAGPRYAYADTITFSVNTDSASSTAAMIAGDYTIGGVIAEMQPYAAQIGLKRNLVENQWTHAIFFNLSDQNKNNVVKNANFRKAIRAIVDHDAIMMAILNRDPRYVLDPSAITPLNTTYYNEILKNCEFNIKDAELAKKYLAASGYKGEEITWLVNEGSPYYRAAVVAIPMLEGIGIKVNLRVVDSGSVSGLRLNPASGYDICYWETQKAIVNPAEQGNFVTGTSTGWWQNEKRTPLVSIIQTTRTGSKESIKAYEDFCRLVTEEVPYIVFGTTKTAVYTRANFVMNYEGIFTYYWNAYFTH